MRKRNKSPITKKEIEKLMMIEEPDISGLLSQIQCPQEKNGLERAKDRAKQRRKYGK